jgi:PhnB protein
MYNSQVVFMNAAPYLNFNGNCREAFEFYAKTLNGNIDAMFTHGETPAAEHVGPEQQETIMHARMTAGDVVLMGSDAPIGVPVSAGGMYISLHVDSAAEADRIFGALSDGGKVIMPIEKTFWAERFGMLNDRYGTPWMVNFAGSVQYDGPDA